MSPKTPRMPAVRTLKPQSRYANNGAEYNIAVQMCLFANACQMVAGMKLENQIEYPSSNQRLCEFNPARPQ